jgi:hypothetical protein
MNQSNSSPEAASPILALCTHAIEIAVGGDPTRGLKILLPALNQARDHGDCAAQLVALTAAAKCHVMRNDAISALASSIDAATLAKQLGERKSTVHAACAIVSSLYSFQLLEDGRKFGEWAISEAVNIGEEDIEGRARQVYGVMLGDLHQFSEAREQLRMALAVSIRHGDLSSENVLHANHASLWRKQAHFFHQKADALPMLSACKEAINRADAVIKWATLNDKEALTVNMHGLKGEMYALLGDDHVAAIETRLAITLASRYKRVMATIPANRQMAAIHQRLGQFALAQEALQSGLSAAEAFRPVFDIAELCEALASNALAAGNRKAAGEWRARFADETRSFTLQQQQARDYLRKFEKDFFRSATLTR